jgi:hypothetical protein
MKLKLLAISTPESRPKGGSMIPRMSLAPYDQDFEGTGTTGISPHLDFVEDAPWAALVGFDV